MPNDEYVPERRVLATGTMGKDSWEIWRERVEISGAWSRFFDWRCGDKAGFTYTRRTAEQAVRQAHIDSSETENG